MSIEDAVRFVAILSRYIARHHVLQQSVRLLIDEFRSEHATPEDKLVAVSTIMEILGSKVDIQMNSNEEQRFCGPIEFSLN